MTRDFEFEDLTRFLPKTITQIYGEWASGKSNLCMIAVVETLLKGKRVVFIDTEGSFSPQRFRQLVRARGGKAEELLKNLIIAEPSDFDEQRIAINKLEELDMSDVGLVVVDSMVSLYRLEMTSEDARHANKELSRQLAKLLRIGKRYEIPIVITNQVYTSFSAEGRNEVALPVGREVVRYWTKVVIQLEKRGNMRVARLIRHKYKKEGGEIIFKITEEGIKNESTVDYSSKQV